jgi:hypothetical protein
MSYPRIIRALIQGAVALALIFGTASVITNTANASVTYYGKL